MSLISLSDYELHDSNMQEEYRSLRTNIMREGSGWQSIAITPSSDEEDFSKLIIRLGIYLAKINQRVLIVDADLQQLTLTKTLMPAKTKFGMIEILGGISRVKECIYKTDVPSLFFLPAGKKVEQTSELLALPVFGETMQQLKERYDWVLVGTASVHGTIDSTLVATACDAVVVGMCMNTKHHKYEQKALEKLKKANANLLGIILISSKSSKSSKSRRSKNTKNNKNKRET
jgi:capsular exopolysaccharide synthesis family protein